MTARTRIAQRPVPARMPAVFPPPTPAAGSVIAPSLSAYQLDLRQRRVRYLDILRRRADGMVAPEPAGGVRDAARETRVGAFCEG